MADHRDGVSVLKDHESPQETLKKVPKKIQESLKRAQREPERIT